MVGMATGTCECGIKRAPMNPNAQVCSFDGFDHAEHLCCNCLLSTMNWRYYEDDACAQCRKRRADAAALAAQGEGERRE